MIRYHVWKRLLFRHGVEKGFLFSNYKQDDQAGFRTMDNSGVDPSDRFSSDNEAGSAADFPQVSLSLSLSLVF